MLFIGLIQIQTIYALLLQISQFLESHVFRRSFLPQNCIRVFFLTNFKSGKTSLFAAFFNEERRASKKSILYSWNWKKSMHAKWSQKSKNSYSDKAPSVPLSIPTKRHCCRNVAVATNFHRLHYHLLFLLVSLFRLDRMDRLHCPTALENPERCDTNFYRIVLAVISKRYSLNNFHQIIKEYSRKVHNTTCFLSVI